MFSLAKGKAWGNLEAACRLKGSYKDDGDEFVVVVVDRVTRGNSHRLQLERVAVEVRKNGPKREL